MSTEATLIAYELLKTGTLVAFRILEEKVLQAGRRQLKLPGDDN